MTPFQVSALIIELESCGPLAPYLSCGVEQLQWQRYLPPWNNLLPAGSSILLGKGIFGFESPEGRIKAESYGSRVRFLTTKYLSKKGSVSADVF